MIHRNLDGLRGTLVPASWLVAVTVGFGAAWRYEATPAAPARGADWPVRTALRRGLESETVVQFVHPDCPCSRAGLDELAGLVGRRARLVVVVVGDSVDAAGIERSENARRARALPGVELAFDPRGTEARRFGAATSGQTFAYSPQGRLLFNGGVTSVRGHYGASAGLDALGDVLAGRPTFRTTTPVYGCALFAEAR